MTDQELPELGAWVGFVLQGGPTEGQVRDALVTGRFIDDPSRLTALARKYGTKEKSASVESIRGMFGDRVNLIVKLQDGDLPGVATGPTFEIQSVQYDKTRRVGTWHFPADAGLDALAESPAPVERLGS